MKKIEKKSCKKSLFHSLSDIEIVQLVSALTEMQLENVNRFRDFKNNEKNKFRFKIAMLLIIGLEQGKSFSLEQIVDILEIPENKKRSVREYLKSEEGLKISKDYKPALKPTISHVFSKKSTQVLQGIGRPKHLYGIDMELILAEIAKFQYKIGIEGIVRIIELITSCVNLKKSDLKEFNIFLKQAIDDIIMINKKLGKPPSQL